jgi:hypothetical protein
MRRTSHQHGSLKLADRRKGKVWEFRWREVQIDGSVCRKNIVVGTLEEFPTESAAQSAVDAIRLTINRQAPQQLLKNLSVRPAASRLGRTSSRVAAADAAREANGLCVSVDEGERKEAAIRFQFRRRLPATGRKESRSAHRGRPEVRASQSSPLT